MDSEHYEISNIFDRVAWGEIAWDDVLKEMSEMLSNCGIHIIHHNPNETHPLKLKWHGIDNHIAKNYEDHYFRLDPWAHLISSKPNDYIFISEKEMPPNQFKNTEYFNEHFIMIKENTSCAGIKLNLNKEEDIFLGIHYDKKTKGMNNDIMRDLIYRIKSPFYQAIRTTQNIIKTSSIISSKALSQQYNSCACMILTEHLDVLELNEQMASILKKNLKYGERTPSSNLMKTSILPPISEKIKSLFKNNFSSSKSCKILINDTPYIFNFTKIDLDFKRPILYHPTLVFVTANNFLSNRVLLNATLLKDLFSLTGTEFRLCQALLDGNKLRSAADITGITYEHARQRLKYVFHKTGTNDQSSLMTLLIKISFWNH